MRAALLPLIALSATLVAAGPALTKRPQSGEEQLAKALAGRTPGKPESCAPLGINTTSENIPGVGILYRDGRTFWVNRFQNGCPSLDTFVTIVTVQHGPLCRGEIARLVDSSTRIWRGTCAYGDFVPYTKPK